MKIQKNAISIFTVMTVIVMWGWLFHACLLWTVQFVGHADYQFNGIFLVAFMVLFSRKILLGLKQGGRIFFRFEPLPLVLFSTSIGGYLLAQRYLDIHIVSCLFMGISFYGLCGLLLPRERWHSAGTLFLLFILILPFNYHLETFVGFPLRLLAAKITHQVLQAVGFHSVSVESIIVLENKAADVALPCSGLKSLWIGTLFFVFISILENYRVSCKWFACMATSILFVVAANIFRILCLVLVLVMGAPRFIRELIHIPVGMVGFIVSCLFIYLLSRRLQKHATEPSCKDTGEYSSFVTVFLPVALVVAIFFQSLQRQQQTSQIEAHLIHLPFTNISLDISPSERELFKNYGVSHYQKFQYTHGKISGTLFLVRAKSWRGHHHPEQCILGQGLSIAGRAPHLVNAATPIRLISLTERGVGAAYWFVSKNRITDDYASRVWASLFHPDKEWVMVSTYFSYTDVHYLEDLDQLSTSINAQVQQILSGGEKG